MNKEEERIEYYTQLKSFLTETGLIKHGIRINNIVAVVEYRCSREKRRGKAFVSFNMESVDHCGDIEIDSEEFPSSKYHIGFSTAWQSYEYDKNAISLIIRDSSPKMGGKYEVEIKI